MPGVAAALSGPRRANAGAVRDFVLGAVLMDGRGEALRFGGQVMKNVAGYDVSRLLAGALGTLGLILEVSLKVLPRPVCEASLRFAMSEIDALTKLNLWAGQPLPLSASCWHDGVLTIRLSGAEAAVLAARRTLGGDEVLDAATFWTALRDQTHGFFDSDTVWRLSVPSAASAIIVGGEQLIEWGGAQRWLKLEDGGDADAIRRTVAAAGGHATRYRSNDKQIPVFHPQAPAVAAIHHRLKASFDPAGHVAHGVLSAYRSGPAAACRLPRPAPVPRALPDLSRHGAGPGGPAGTGRAQRHASGHRAQQPGRIDMLIGRRGRHGRPGFRRWRRAAHGRRSRRAGSRAIRRN